MCACVRACCVLKLTPGGARSPYDDAGVAGDGGDAAAGFQKALSVVDLESRLDVGGEVVETVLSVLEGESYRYVGGRDTREIAVGLWWSAE